MSYASLFHGRVGEPSRKSSVAVSRSEIVYLETSRKKKLRYCQMYVTECSFTYRLKMSQWKVSELASSVKIRLVSSMPLQFTQHL